MDDSTRRDEALTELLAERLPQYPASLALKRRLAAQWAAAHEPPRTPWWRRHAFVVPAFATALLLLLTLPLAYQRLVVGPARATTLLVAQAVDTHVRATQTPLGIESSGQHDVKPWFTGKLDFAPSVAFMGDAEFPLRGGAIGTYVDRPAAILVFARRKHTISLLVFRPEGLPQPGGESTTLGRTRATVTSSRGFNVILWRSTDLGYALISDVDRSELLTLATKLSSG